MPDDTPALLNWSERQLGRVAGLLAIAGGVALAGLMLETVIAVIWRYILNDPIFGIEDTSTMALTVVVAAAVAYGAHHNSHVGINVIRYFAGRRVTRYTDLVARILLFAIIATAAYALFDKGRCGLPCGAITNNLSIVHTPFYYILGVSLTSYALLVLVHIALGILHWNGDDPNEPGD